MSFLRYLPRSIEPKAYGGFLDSRRKAPSFFNGDSTRPAVWRATVQHS
jgi:hypothetical protein